MKFASQKGFDPLIPDNWYSYKAGDIFSSIKVFVFKFYLVTLGLLRLQGGYGALMHYNFNLQKALEHLFPDIGLEPHKFKPTIHL